MNSDGEVTALLARIEAGDKGAADDLLPLVYEQLRGLARGKMARERAGHTLQATALANEAFVKLLQHERVQWQSRAHFFAIAALAMRRILVNHAKARIADKRGGEQVLATFEDAALGRAMRPDQIVALDEALSDLAVHNERYGKVVTYKFFGGMTYEEIAETLDVSVPTVRRDWRFARAWLLRELSRDR